MLSRGSFQFLLIWNQTPKGGGNEESETQYQTISENKDGRTYRLTMSIKLMSYIIHSLITISAARKMGGQKLMVRLSLVMEKRRPRSSDKSSTASSLPTLSKAPGKGKVSAVLSREKNFSYWKFEAPYRWHLVSVGTIEELIEKVSHGAFSHLREEAVEKRFFSTKYSFKQKTGDVYEIHQIIET